jgi:tRNA G46 methylase TrmB
VRRIDRDTWEAPPVESSGDARRVRGALGGTLLLDRPEHRAFRDTIVDFVTAPGPLALEIGFDFGERLLGAARAHPDVRWLGCELRRARVEAVAAGAPANLLAVRADARTLLSSLIPPGRLSYAYVMFPTPTLRPSHLLLTPDLVALLARALGPTGVLHVATDVPGMARLADALLAGWRPAALPPTSPVPSRRERVCARDGLPVFVRTVAPPV